MSERTKGAAMMISSVPSLMKNHPLFFEESVGAMSKHSLQRLEEHGISRRKYSSRTIFCTLPLLVDRTYTLLERLG